jgi:predicted nucleic-acid-binding protein
MKLAVDTNLLIRYLAWDDVGQARNAAAQIEAADILFISTIVLCETVWVLRRAYRYSSDEIMEALSDLIHSRNVEVDHPAAEAGLRMLARGGDFADGVIEHDAILSNCDRVSTFDQTFQELLTPKLRKA